MKYLYVKQKKSESSTLSIGIIKAFSAFACNKINNWAITEILH